MQFSEMTIAQIKEFLDANKVQYLSKMKKADLIALAESVKPVKVKTKKLTTFPEYPTKVPASEIKAEDGNEVGQLASQVFNAPNPLAVLMGMSKGTRRKVRQFLYQKGYKHLASLRTPPTAPSQHKPVRRLAVA